jgi:hypothetical protein
MVLGSETSRPEPALSVHRFSFWGALGRTALLLFCSLFALTVGFGCLSASALASRRSPLEAALWGLFSLCGFVSFAALVREGLRTFMQTPTVMFVYRSGLGWRKRGKEIRVSWAEITRIDRDVTEFENAGRLHQVDTTTIHFASGKTLRIWKGILTDYLTFADSVKYFHDMAGVGTMGIRSENRQRTKPMRCWHCSESFDVVLQDQAVQVHCPRCKAGLGAVVS